LEYEDEGEEDEAEDEDVKKVRIGAESLGIDG
jgi:hypothetical protein